MSVEVLEQDLNPENPYVEFLIKSSKIAGAVSRFCDRAEHNRLVENNWVLDAAQNLRDLVVKIAAYEEQDLISIYFKRLDDIEFKNVLHGAVEDLPAHRKINYPDFTKVTWRDLQIIQHKHDSLYHPDVVGLAKIDQLRHYAFHLAKLNERVAEVLESGKSDDFVANRLPDLVLFSVKLSTVFNQTLEEEKVL